MTFQDLCGWREISRHSYKTNKSIDQLLKETEKEAPKTAPKPAQKSADSSDDDFVSDDDEGMIYTIITDRMVNTPSSPHVGTKMNDSRNRTISVGQLFSQTRLSNRVT